MVLRVTPQHRLLSHKHYSATVQLSVLVIVAVGPALLLSEPVTMLLAISSALTVTGMWLVVVQWSRR